MSEPIDWVYDWETTVRCALVVFEDVKSDERRHFIIHPTQDDFGELVKFMYKNINAKDRHLGYNNIGFDGQINQFIINNVAQLVYLPTIEKIKIIYEFAQKLIEDAKNGEYPPFREEEFSIPQIDVYRLNGWDTNAKRAGLKWIQFTTHWPNLEDMPYDHTYPIRTYRELGEMLNYCYNDVVSTKMIYNLESSSGTKLTWEQLDLRKELSEKFGLHLYSAPEPKISKEIFLHFLSEKLKVPKNSLRKKRTIRKEVVIKDIVLPSVKFNTPEFNDILVWFNNMVADTTPKAQDDEDKGKGPKFTIFHKGVKTDYGLGGIHGCILPGVYVSDDEYMIKSADVVSFYPMLAIKNGWHPEHIPAKEFCDLYEWFFDERRKFPKGTPLNYLFKIVLNATYGLSKSIYSFLYDPKFTYQITVNGQLLLSMLYEELSTRIPDSLPLMQNTDGLEFRIPREHEALFDQICKEWEDKTKLSLEFDNYDKLIISDVNNYIGIYDTGKTKCKGRFEFEGRALHKNSSNTIVPKALYAYFVENTPVAEFLKNNTNILDYCLAVKMHKGWYLEQHKQDGTVVPLQKTIRYYNSSSSEKNGKILKRHTDGRILQLDAGRYLQEVMNVYDSTIPWEGYDIDLEYYEQAILGEISKILQPKSHIKKLQKAKTAKFKPQLSLF
jgi:hypothetical protein